MHEQFETLGSQLEAGPRERLPDVVDHVGFVQKADQAHCAIDRVLLFVV